MFDVGREGVHKQSDVRTLTEVTITPMAESPGIVNVGLSASPGKEKVLPNIGS